MRNVVNRGIQITKAGIRVVRKHPHLLVLTVVAGLMMLGLTIGAVAVLKYAGIKPLAQHYGRAALFFVPVMFLATLISTFWGVAFTRAALRALRDEPASLGDSIGFAVSRIPALAAYSLLAATVGLVIGLFEKMTARVGGYVTGFLFGFAWSTATFLVVPVLVQERRGMLASLRRSNDLIEQTAGERVVGQVGQFLVAIPVCVLAGLVFTLAEPLWATHFAAAVGLVGVGGLVAVAILAVSVAVHQLYGVALYQFAVEGVAPQEFDRTVGDTVWLTR